MPTKGHLLGDTGHTIFCSQVELTVSRRSLTSPLGSHRLQPPFLAELLVGKRQGDQGTR